MSVALLERTIEKLVKQHGSYRAAAKAIDVDHVYLHRVQHSKRGPSETLLSKLGLERVVTYRTASEQEGGR